MSTILTLMRKELRAYFASPVALIFLAIFLVACLYSLFGQASFFARNLADVRPLFEWMPLLLILLVAAITMRQWSEEQKMGTLEVLLTLPIPVREMVLGKFLAGIVLVALGLLLTLPVPIMVDQLGDLDWGPVFGGYLGALLLGAAYLAIGLCVSSRTDNQVVALMTTLAVAGTLYLLGSDRITSLFANDTAQLLRGLGSGSRFESIERGVLDLRDLVYYVGLGIFFLTLNWYFLESERLDRNSPNGRSRAGQLGLLVGLVALNILAANVWLAPVAALRIDMTQRGEYSIDPVTIDTLAALGEPLTITGYFSERSHPLLSPLVPQIRDLLAEYAVRGGDPVTVEFVDPNQDPEIEQEIGERYGIRSFPFRIVDRHEQAVVNAFFHVLVEYGDQYETLSFDQLIDVNASDEGVEVRLRNLEYDLTRTIKRVSQDFQSMESVFELLPGSASLTLYVTPETLPADFVELPERFRKIAGELRASAGGKLEFREVDPSRDPELEAQLDRDYGIQPLAVDLFGRRTFFLDAVLEAGGKVQRIMPRSDLGEADLRSAIEAGIRRATPGQLKTVGLYTATPPAPPPNPQLPPQLQPPPPHPDYRVLAGLFGEEFSFEQLELESGFVPETIDVLILGKTGALSARQQFAIDQYLMRGGKLIVLAGRFEIAALRSGLRTEPAAAPLFDLLSTWGVEVGLALVMDPRNAAFPIPVQETRGGFRMQRIEMIPYPFFVDVREDGFDADHISFEGIQSLTLPWSSPLTLAPAEGVEAQMLIESSAGSWLNESGRIEPDMQLHPGAGFGPTGELARQGLAAVLEGGFPSHFADRPSPLFGADPGAPDADGAAPDATGRTMKKALPDARLVVVGSSELASDLIFQLSQQPGGEVHRGNMQWLQNLVDWSVEDTDLLSIRSSGAFARTLRPLEEGEARRIELLTYLAVFAGLVAVALLAGRLLRGARNRGFAEQESSG